MAGERHRLPRAACAGFVLTVVLWSAAARAALPPDDATTASIRRVLTLLHVTSGEYREGVANGAIVLAIEYEEARAFSHEAQQRLEQTLGQDGQQFVAAFSTLRAAMEAKAHSTEVRRQADALRAAITAATGVNEDVYPATPPSASRGRALFANNCVSCHGVSADGRGVNAEGLNPPPANFTDATFMRDVTPFDLFNIVTVGKSTAAMPSWEDVLSIQDRWDLVSYLWTVHPGPTGLAEGQGVYLVHCAGCHGTTADGRGALSATLLKPAVPLNDVAALAGKSDAEIFAHISDGVPGTPMPRFADVLSAEQRWAAVAFLRMLALGGDDGTKQIVETNDVDARRFAGLLRLLADEYGKAVGDGTANDRDYRKSAILSDLMKQRGANALVALTMHAPDRTETVRHDIERIASIVTNRGAAMEVSSLATKVAQIIDTSIPATTVESGDALTATKGLLDDALAAYRAGDARASYLVSDAYFQFEPFEAKLNVTDPDLRRRIEGRFLELRGVLSKPGAEAQAAAVIHAIGSDLDEARRATAPSGNAYALFTQAAMIILREGFEVVLVVGALLAYVTKSGTKQMRTAILSGTAAGVLVSLVSAYGLALLLQSTAVVAEVIEGVTMLLAAVVLFSVSYWLISKAEAEKWQRYIQGKVKSAVSRGSAFALAGAAFLAVFREGIETVLFYQALIAGAGPHTGAAIAGFVVGCVALSIVYVLFQRFGKRMPIRQFFLVTGGLLYYLSFVFAGRGVSALQQIGWLPTTPVAGLPAVDLIGFHPTVETLVAQGILLACLVYALIVSWRERPPAASNLDASRA